MYRYSQQVRSSLPSGAIWRRLTAALAILSTVAAIIAIIYGANAAHFRARTAEQLEQRILGEVSSAIDQANRLPSSIQSSTASRLGLIREHVYCIEQLNSMSVALRGESDGRLVPQDAVTALYDDLEVLETLSQTSTSSTLEARTLLLTHLAALQSLMNP